jgi:large subunit ribosomal protein L24
MARKFKIKKGDEVVVLTGRDKGKSGEVLAVRRSEDRVVVRGVNIVKRHQRPSQTQPGGIVDKEAPIHISNVAHIDPKEKKPTRIGFKFLEGGRKVRFAKRSGEVIDR